MNIWSFLDIVSCIDVIVTADSENDNNGIANDGRHTYFRDDDASTISMSMTFVYVNSPNSNLALHWILKNMMRIEFTPKICNVQKIVVVFYRDIRKTCMNASHTGAFPVNFKEIMGSYF